MTADREEPGPIAGMELASELIPAGLALIGPRRPLVLLPEVLPALAALVERAVAALPTAEPRS